MGSIQKRMLPISLRQDKEKQMKYVLMIGIALGLAISTPAQVHVDPMFTSFMARNADLTVRVNAEVAALIAHNTNQCKYPVNQPHLCDADNTESEVLTAKRAALQQESID